MVQTDFQAKESVNGSFRCAACPALITKDDPREKIGRFTYCAKCAALKKEDHDF